MGGLNEDFRAYRLVLNKDKWQQQIEGRVEGLRPCC